MRNLLFLLIFVPFFAQAQLSFGVKTGLNLSKVEHNFDGPINHPLGGSNSRYGGHIGLWGNYTFGKRLATQIEFQYSMEGAKEEGYHLGYLNIPIVFRINLFEYYNEKSFFLEAGLEYGKVIKDEWHLLQNEETKSSFIIGAGAKIGEKSILNFRYVHGITKIFKDINKDFFGNPVGEFEGKGRFLQLSVEIILFE